MPDLMGKTDKDLANTISGFQFSTVELDDLEASEYTLAVILVDETTSVGGYEKGLEKCIKEIVESCSKSPRSENLLVLTARFSTGTPGTVEQIHGFNLLSNIDVNQYDGCIRPGGMTPLRDATMAAIEMIQQQAKILTDQEYLCNAVFYLLTDGGENASRKASYKQITNKLADIKKKEELESIQAFLIGVNDTDCKDDLDDFHNKAGFDDFMSMGDITPTKLAKMAKWVSTSLSSTSTALGSGGPSQPVPQPSFSL